MKKHIKIYMDYFGYGMDDKIPCLGCHGVASGIHHLSSRGMGGSKNKDFIENLVPVCMICHNRCHNDKKFNLMVKEKHLKRL